MKINDYYQRYYQAWVARLEKRFWDKVEICGADECWIWKELLDPKGYGYFTFTMPSIEGKGDKIKISSHRMAFLLSGGDIPEGKEVVIMHKCDNPPCVNPFHLEVGTIALNNLDKKQKGRTNSPKGSDSGTAKLTENDVLEMRQLYATGQWTHKQLAQKFSVTYGNVGFIVRGEQWQHVGGPIVKYGKRGEIKAANSYKLSAEDVEQIQKEYRITPVRELVGRYGIDQSTVHKIGKKLIWNEAKRRHDL